MIVLSKTRSNFLATCVLGYMNPNFEAETSCAQNIYEAIVYEEEPILEEREISHSFSSASKSILFITIFLTTLICICVYFLNRTNSQVDQGLEEMKREAEEAGMIMEPVNLEITLTD